MEVREAGRMTQFAQRLCFNLADTLSRHIVAVADFLECQVRAIHQAKAHFENLSLPLPQQGQDVLKLSLSMLWLVASDGFSASLSSMKSLTRTSPSSPTGASSETGCRAILSSALTR